MKSKMIYFVPLIVFLIVFSFVTTYKIPDLTKESVDRVLILTPYGIIKNFVTGNKAFYFQAPPLRYENFWRNLSCYFPILFFSGLLIFKKED
jgi:hypothetical protein